jgi:rhamnose transport system ATP-binding protein
MRSVGDTPENNANGTATWVRPPALEVRGISKRFGAVQAVDDVSIEIPSGSIVALMGENGAGKSTVSRIASGLVTADKGEILIDGRRVQLRIPADAEEVGIRIVPQEIFICEGLSVAENICLSHLPRAARGLLSPKTMYAQARDRVTSLGLDDLDVRRPAGGLSVVEKAFVQIARALTPGARVLFFDEPTAPMSATEVDRVLGVMKRIADSDVGVVFVSHRLDEVLQVAEKAVVLRDGRNVGEFVGDAMERDHLINAMVGGRDLHVDREERATGEVLLEIDGISGEHVDDVSLQVHRGEIVGVYGVAGSGREKLGAMVAGAEPRKGGRVMVGGAEVRAGNVRAAVAAGIGYVPPERRSQGLLIDHSIRTNLSLAILGRLRRHGFLSPSRERTLATKWCDRLRIRAASIEAPMDSMSGGNQQKVLLARWLAAETPVLVLEEPTRGVDIATKAEIYRLLRELSDDGMAILYTTSDIEEVTLVGDRVAILRRGRVVSEMRAPTQEAVMRAALAVGPASGEGIE